MNDLRIKHRFCGVYIIIRAYPFYPRNPRPVFLLAFNPCHSCLIILSVLSAKSASYFFQNINIHRENGHIFFDMPIVHVNNGHIFFNTSIFTVKMVIFFLICQLFA